MARRIGLIVALIASMLTVAACQPTCEFRHGAKGYCYVGDENK